MIAPRWRKVMADLFANKVRTLVVVISIAVGIFAVGIVTTSFPIILDDMDKDFQSVNPHAAVIYCEPFRDDLLESIKRIPGIQDVEGRSAVTARILVDNATKIPISFVAIASIDKMKIDRLQPGTKNGSLTLGDHELFIDRSAQSSLPFKEGDMVTVELVDGHTRQLRIASYIHDVTAIPYIFMGQISAYVTPETIKWLGGSEDYYQMYLTVSENKTNEAYVTEIAKQASSKIEKGGKEVYFTLVYKPGRHFASDITQALGMIMGFLGFLSVILSGFLVINTINALLAQHIRQIGMMKAIGGETKQLVMMYLILVMCFGALALIIAMPISSLASFGIAEGIAKYLNFNVAGYRIPTISAILQISIAFVVPVFAAIAPVWNGARLTIREAISNYGLGKGQFGKNWIDRLLEKIRGLSRPLLLSLRNTFRRKVRLALTLSTLVLAGAIFIAVFNLRAAMHIAIDQTLGYFLSDVNVDFTKPHRIQKLESVVLSVPNVAGMEGWGFSSAQLLSADKKTSTQVLFTSPPSTSKLIKPVMIRGRWLVPEDESAIVIGNALLKVRPEVKVGDNLTFKIKDREVVFHVVGEYKMAGNMPNPLIYSNYEYIARLRDEVDQVMTIRVVTSSHDALVQQQVAQFLDVKFRKAGIQVSQITTGANNAAQNAAQIDVLVYFLLVMAVLIALVGGLGLMGMMSMNVMERTREIGVMRAIGASDGSIMMLVIVEGLIVGIASWILAILVAIPISGLLSNVVGSALLNSPLTFVFSPDGFIIWLIGILVISALASALPARNASRLTIREVLAYE